MLSLGLPPPPAYTALSGGSRHPRQCCRNTVSESRHAKTCRSEGISNGLGCSCVCCSPLILFPRNQPSVDSNASESADSNREATREGLGDKREMRGVWCRRGRGVISATRGGESVYLDTHPADTSVAWPLVMPLEIEGSGAAVAAQQASTISRRGHSLHASADRSGDGNEWSSMSKGVSNKPTSSGNVMQETIPAIPSELIPPSVEAATGLGRAEPRCGLGDMSRRGRLVRAKMKFSCLSVMGVRFVKAVTWCNSCGLVGALMSRIYLRMFELAFI